MVWMGRDAKGDLHGPFQFLAGKGGFVFYAAAMSNAVALEPWTLVQVENTADPRPPIERFNEAIKGGKP